MAGTRTRRPTALVRVSGEASGGAGGAAVASPASLSALSSTCRARAGTVPPKWCCRAMLPSLLHTFGTLDDKMASMTAFSARSTQLMCSDVPCRAYTLSDSGFAHRHIIWMTLSSHPAALRAVARPERSECQE